MSKHLTKCKWCEYGAYSYKYGEWNCWKKEEPLTDQQAKCGCREYFTPSKDCPDSVIRELGLNKSDKFDLLGLWLNSVNKNSD
jgi:hypothetical protein